MSGVNRLINFNHICWVNSIFPPKKYHLEKLPVPPVFSQQNIYRHQFSAFNSFSANEKASRPQNICFGHLVTIPFQRCITISQNINYRIPKWFSHSKTCTNLQKGIGIFSFKICNTSRWLRRWEIKGWGIKRAEKNYLAGKIK